MEKKNQITISKKGLITFVVIALIIIGANAYATSKGYSNIFFMINHTNKEEVVTDKDEILSEQVEEILKEKFEVGTDLYFLDEKYFSISSDSNNIVQTDEYGSLHLITNYDEVVNKFFTDRIKKDFEKKAVCLVVYNNKHYLAEGGPGFVQFDKVESFDNTVVTDNKITTTCKIREKDPDDNFLGYEYAKFSLVKQGNDWLIDEMEYWLGDRNEMKEEDISNNNNTTESLVKEKFEQTVDLYFLDGKYFKISENYIDAGSEYGYIYLLENYDEVVDKYFTDNMKKDFENNAYLLVNYNNKHYLVEGGGFHPYDGIESIENIVATDNKITATVKTREGIPGENSQIELSGYKDVKFTLVKSGNDWLVDEFDSRIISGLFAEDTFQNSISNIKQKEEAAGYEAILDNDGYLYIVVNKEGVKKAIDREISGTTDPCKVTGLSNKIEKIYQGNAGLDPSPITFIIMKDGSLYSVMPLAQIVDNNDKIPTSFKAEICKGAKGEELTNIVDIKENQYDDIIAVTKDGKEIKIIDIYSVVFNSEE